MFVVDLTALEGDDHHGNRLQPPPGGHPGQKPIHPDRVRAAVDELVHDAVLADRPGDGYKLRVWGWPGMKYRP